MRDEVKGVHSPGSITIESYHERYEDAIVALNRHHCEELSPWVPYIEEHVRQSLRTSLGATEMLAVATTDSEVIGYALGRLEPFYQNHFEKQATLVAIYVTPTKRVGITALALLDTFLTWGRDSGAVEVSAGVVSHLADPERVCRLFERRGFVKEGYMLRKLPPGAYEGEK